METNCTGGGRSKLEVKNNGPCNTCVGFSRFVENGNGTITVTLTNGQSFTYRVKGSDGPPGVKGDTGDTGATGAKGASGTTVLWNDNDTHTTTTPGQQVLTSFNMAAGQMASNGDIVQIKAKFRTADYLWDNVAKYGSIWLAGTLLVENLMQFDYSMGLELNVLLSRTTPNAGVYEADMLRLNLAFIVVQAGLNYKLLVVPVAKTWANAQLIEIKANRNGGKNITLESFKVLYYKK